MSAPPSTPSVAELRRRLPALMLRDERRLRRRLERARTRRDAEARQAGLAEVAEEITAAEQRLATRRAAVPAVDYPAELPITAVREELLATIAAHQVVVVAGETGSGKTTQLPKLCLELGRGVQGRIGHTQPRRIAARTVAARIADELGVDAGAEVGHTVRFRDDTSERTLVKVATDGILLAEIGRDPLLRAYDTVIVDEAHERSLNIDFLLGYLARLLPRRPDLKVIITSATIDVERFAAHFGDAPIIEVSGRTYPVEVRYRPLEATGDDDVEQDQIAGICDAVDELTGEGPGDMLVFLPGERDIREAADALRSRVPAGTEILPLYARLSPAQQQRVFRPQGRRRIVLATNVAETSLTVPGIHYVIDTGTARISRYSPRTKVQRLPIERVSQASADQRKGRCGRIAEGICIRLYSEADYEARPAFTDPEILRTNLASVILQMTALGLGDIADFPFLDPPEARSIRAAVQLLHELGAVATDDASVTPELTDVGRVMARLPIDPRLARMIVEGDRRGCLREVLVIAAVLAIGDPRQRPAEQRQAADAWHARFTDERSDFSGYLALWEYVTEQRRALSAKAFRRRCADEFLHHARIREWQDLHAQLRDAAKDSRLTRNHTPADAEQVHRALLAGLLSHIGVHRTDTREYQGARGTRFALWPGSALAKTPPAFVMAGELVETSRLFARDVAAIEPEWAEQAASHLVERTYDEPRWDARRGAAVATERVTLYGVPLVDARTVTYARIDAEASRELFLRHALVEGEWDTHHGVVTANRRLLAELAEAEQRTRRAETIADADDLYRFYDERIPAEVVSARHFDAWWKDAAAAEPHLLTATRELLAGDHHPAVRAEDFPDVWHHGELTFELSYRFEPGAADDGVTVHIPLAVLNRCTPAAFTWQVPGLRGELVTALLRALPKQWRRELVPLPDVAAAVLEGLEPADEPLVTALAREVAAVTGVDVPAAAWNPAAVDDHLRMTFRIVDDGRTLAAGKDLAALQAQLAGDARGAVSRAAGGLTQRGQTAWTFGTLPRVVDADHHGAAVRGFPALVDEGETVGVRVLLSEAEQQHAMWAGTRRLLRLAAPLPATAVNARLERDAKLALARNPHGSVTALLDDAAACALDALLAAHGGPAWDAESFAKLADAVAGEQLDTVLDVLATTREILAAAHEVEGRLAELDTPALASTRADAGAHLGLLVHPGFLTATGYRRLGDLTRYLRALAVRLDKAPRDPGRDVQLAARIGEVRDAYVALLRRLGPRAGDDAREIRWMIEELAVSLFAQQLGTRHKVSEPRVFGAIAAAEA